MLNREEIRSLVLTHKLIEGHIDLETQLTPNGFDLTASRIFAFDTPGELDFSNQERRLPVGKELYVQKRAPGDAFGWWDLPKGVYKVTTGETVSLPKDLIAMAFSRTSLLRMGAFCQHGVWDAGFKGRSEFILIVENPFGMKLKQNARVAQLVFVRIKETGHGYQGIYQNL